MAAENADSLSALEKRTQKWSTLLRYDGGPSTWRKGNGVDRKWEPNPLLLS